MQRIETIDNEYIITDEYGAKLIVIPFEMVGEQWVQIYSDNEDDVIRSFLEEADKGIHLPLWMFELFGAYVIGNQKQSKKKRDKKENKKSHRFSSR